ncbi:MAG: pilus assembly protein PilM [Candidatus Paceibacterota bacterium]|jgi:Tfp pilus assembly PilM family ATPase
MRISLASLSNLLSLLKPRVAIGGLEISEMGVSFVGLHMAGKDILSLSVRTPEQMFSEGRMSNTQALIDALRRIHDGIAPKSEKKIPVVVSIPDTFVYTQTLSLPRLQGGDFLDAVKLNLQTISPIDFSSAYYDWETIASLPSDGMEIGILASFVKKQLIEDILAALDQAHLYPVAIEQKSVSLVRALTTHAPSFEPTKSYCFIHVASDGISLSIVRGGVFFFNRSLSWPSIVDLSRGVREISFSQFKGIVTDEIRPVLNFYTNHFQDSIAAIYVIAPGLTQEVQEIIAQQFATPVFAAQLPGEYGLMQEWAAPLGAALRGLIPRSADKNITLTPQGAQTQYLHSQVFAFVSLWRTIVVVVSVFVIAIFMGSYLFLHALLGSTSQEVSAMQGGSDASQLTALQNEAKQFNKNISGALEIRSAQVHWMTLIDDIESRATSAGITIQRILIQSKNDPVSIEAQANSEAAEINFKTLLLGSPFVLSADIPLGSVTQSGSKVNFKMTIVLRQIP